jgi:antitoxin component YwqK of YwqJK toxin-antitoxin module
MEKKTKSITVTQYDYIINPDNEEEIDPLGHPNHYSEFDADGRPLKDIKYNRAGEFEEMFEYAYDEHGNLVRESYYPVEGEVAEEKTFIRNEQDLVVQALKQYQDGSLDTITYVYNEAGELIRRTTTNDEGEIEQVEIFDWANGEIANHLVLDENGDPMPEPENLIKPNESRITHNENGQVITEEELDDDGEAFMVINRSYFDDGLADEVDVFVDGRGRGISRHYFLKHEYTFFD